MFENFVWLFYTEVWGSMSCSVWCTILCSIYWILFLSTEWSPYLLSNNCKSISFQCIHLNPVRRQLAYKRGQNSSSVAFVLLYLFQACAFYSIWNRKLHRRNGIKILLITALKAPSKNWSLHYRFSIEGAKCFKIQGIYFILILSCCNPDPITSLTEFCLLFCQTMVSDQGQAKSIQTKQEIYIISCQRHIVQTFVRKQWG